MLTGTQIAVIGGDRRQLEMIQLFSETDATVQLFGYENMSEVTNNCVFKQIETDGLSTADAIVLPVTGIHSNGEVDNLFANQPLILQKHHFGHLKKGVIVYTGIASERLREWCMHHRIQCRELLDRDDVAIYNAIPTAEGAIMLAIQQTDFTLHQSTCLVLGYGRVGKTLAQLLYGLGAIVKVGVRKPEQFARALTEGLRPFYMSDLCRVIGDANIVFNTVPALVLTSDRIALLPIQSLIIDLASKPGGTDFRFADKRGIKSILALGLPGKVAAKTAGNILGRAIIEDLQAIHR